MIHKILIANRGEIACRVIRTARKLGYRTVAVYSEADAQAPHVSLADEAVCIGPAPAAESYLKGEVLLAACRQTGANAIHPGYGFLSENAGFAQACRDAGVIFIGPSPEAIRVMGDKAGAKQEMIKAGVPTAPGYLGADQNDEVLMAEGQRLGYPLLVKAVSGGGGRGMRLVHQDDELAQAIVSARREAQSAFGDGTLMLERLILDGRHIEIQVFADSHGNAVYIGERDCTAQRRRQKVIEESPSPVVSPAMREAMGRDAVLAAKAIHYCGAGTIEYIVDQDLNYYFLEMNTRLQVEHPVTEMVTGLDLVEWQLRIASGEPLPFDQRAIRFNGWAIEARICAEEPTRGFIPSTGMITRYFAPRGAGVRVDSGVNIGGKIDVFYDSMLAKLICHGKTREDARRGLVEALNGYHIEGVNTNIDFVTRVLCLPEFAEGNLHTGFIDQHFEGGRAKLSPPVQYLRLTALAATLIYHTRTVAVRKSLRHMVSEIGIKHDHGRPRRYMVRCQEDVFEIVLEEPPVSGQTCAIRADGTLYKVEIPRFEFFRRRLKLNINGQDYRFRIRFHESFMFMSFNGVSRLFEVYTPKEWEMMQFMPEKEDKGQSNILLCPMPGLVVDVLAQKGERVFRGQNLVVLESMKMESGVASPIDGVIAEVLVNKGQAVEADQTLIRFEAG